MTTRTSTLLSLAAIVLLLAALLGCGPAFATALLACQSSSTGVTVMACVTSASSAVLFGFVLSLAGVLASIFAWIIGLVNAVHLRHWGWFLVVLLLSPLGTLLYGLASPTTSVQVLPAPPHHRPVVVAPPKAAAHEHPNPHVMKDKGQGTKDHGQDRMDDGRTQLWAHWALGARAGCAPRDVAAVAGTEQR